jgi:hypothetical protein
VLATLLEQPEVSVVRSDLRGLLTGAASGPAVRFPFVLF